MAARHTSVTGRQRYISAESRMYVYGNAVPKPQETSVPERRVREEPRRKVTRQVQKNRKRALRMSRGYVVFLSIAAVLALIICVNYVKMQSRLTSYSKEITALQEELANMREENNTKYNTVMDSVNLEEIREKAQKDLGMVYASPEQVVEYDKPATDYVRQYEDIPKDGVLAQSSKK